MTKVLFLINNLSGGGAEKVLVNLANELSKDRYDVTIRTLVDKGENKKFLNEYVKYEYIFKRNFKGLNYLYLLPHKYIYKKVAYGEYDVIIVYLHGVLTRIVGYAPQEQKTIAYLHANMEKSPFIQKFKSKEDIKKCFETYNTIVAVSEDVRDSFVRVSGISDTVCVKYNTFAVEDIRKNSQHTVCEENLAYGAVKLCSVGKLENVKGYMRLVKILKRLRDDNIDVSLNLVGEGSEKKDIEAYIQENNLQQNVSLIGFDTNPYKYIKQSDLFVCSSYSEGFSSVVAESLILGVPVLTTDCAGMREMLGENGEYGIIVKNDDEALYRGLKMLISDKQMLEQYKNKASERAKFFEPKETVGEIKKMIDEVVGCQN